jgi:outer membrane protein assembly complex protein YaeT
MSSSFGRAESGSRIFICLVLVSLLLHGTLPVLAQEPSEMPPLITDLRIEQEGRAVTDPVLLGLIETTPGKRFSRVDMRESTSHLAGLNRFEDVQPWTEPTPDGVRVVYRLIPLRPIDRMEFEGTLGLSEGQLRSAVRDSLGTALAASRIEAAKGVLSQRYFDSGYVAARIDHKLVPRTEPDRSTLVFVVDAGMRALVTNVVVEPQDSKEVPAGFPVIQSGRPYDRQEIDETLRKYVDNLRKTGYYEARAEAVPELTADGVNLRVQTRRGPRVQVVFKGDPLTRSEQQRLVPVRAQASVDEDLLENASIDIERYLRERGYRDARAPYTRAQGPQEQTITFDIMRGPLYQVGEIRFSGQQGISETDLRPGLRFETKEPFIEGVVVADAYQIEQQYQAQGFTQVKVTPSYSTVTPETATAARRVDVTLMIDEGPRFIVNSVSFAGNTAISEPELLDLVQIKPGDAYNGRRIEEDRLLIAARYRDLGFETVEVPSPVFTAVDDRVALLFSISEGMQVFIDKIIIDGNERTRSETIERELLLHPGDPMGASNRVRSEANLRALGLFRRVRIEERRHTGDDRVDVVVRVEEAPRTTIGYGGGVEISERLRPAELGAEEQLEFVPRGFFEIGRRNLWGGNRSANLFTRVSLRSRDEVVRLGEIDTSYGVNEYRVLGTFREPRVLGSTAAMLVTGIAERAIRPSYTFVTREARAEVARQVLRDYNVSGRFSIKKAEAFDVDPNLTDEQKPIVDRLFPQVRLSKLSGSLVWNTRDNNSDPDRGAIFTGELEVAPKFLGSEVGFVKGQAELSWYKRLPVRRRAVFAVRGMLGAAHGFNTEVNIIADSPVVDEILPDTVQTLEDLPASERFFAGGSTTHRGFSIDQLGELDTFTPSGFPTGGNAQVLINGELRVSLFRDVAGVGFTDFGNVFKRAADIDLGSLRPGLGGGLHYNSGLVGVVRAEIGFNPDRRILPGGRRERGYVLHISLGKAF